MADSVRGLVAESLAVLRWEVPTAFDRLGAKLAGLPVHFEVGGVAFGLDPTLRLVDPPATPRVVLRTEGATITALLQGRLDLRRAVLDGRLYLLGTLYDLRRLLGALDVYMHGAVRAPGFVALRHRWEESQHE